MTPVILTALGGIDDRVEGLESGGDVAFCGAKGSSFFWAQ
jgi:hypothetical protein